MSRVNVEKRQMRRLMLLGLLALALPTATLASSINVSNPDPMVFTTGTFMSGTIATTSGSSLVGPGTALNITIVGSENTLMLSSTLTSSCPTDASCTFSGGSVTITNNTGTIFTSSLSNGTFDRRHAMGGTNRHVENFEASLINNLGTVTISDFNWLSGSDPTAVIDPLSAPIAVVSVIPEPGTLGLLGTGLIGLAGMARRKLKLCT